MLGPSEFPSKLVFSASRLPGMGWSSCLDEGGGGSRDHREYAYIGIYRDYDDIL